MRCSIRSSLVFSIAALVACGPAVPEAEEANGKTTVTVTKGEWTEPPKSNETAGGVGGGAKEEIAPAVALDPAAKPSLASPSALVGGSAAEGPLPVPTAIAAAKGHLYVFGRTRAGWVVRVRATNALDPKKVDYSQPIVVAPAFDDDAEPTAVGDGESAWFGVSTIGGGNTRVVRVDSAGNVTSATSGVPSGLGRIAVLVPLKAHIAVIGRAGASNVTFTRLMRNGTFPDTAVKIIAQTTENAGARSRSPRAVMEDDRILMAWDGRELAGALESPGTTPEEKAAPKPGIYVRRFEPNGEPASPLRRLTRPGFEAHALDVAVELGACAILAKTDAGYEMFRFVRKGTELSPYGGGLHLAPAETPDVALSTDVVGTLAVTSNKLLRIGPGVKIVPSDLPFKPPTGGDGAFDDVRVSSDGSVAHVVLDTRGFAAGGALPTIAKIEGEKMGGVLPTPWIGPPAQRLVFAGFEAGEGIALVVDAGKLRAVRFSPSGAPTSSTDVAFEGLKLDDLDWPRAPVPRLARTNDWALATKDGRIAILTGPHAGKVIAPGVPSGAGTGGFVALTSNAGKPGVIRAFYLPAAERLALLSTATIDPTNAAVVDAWAPIPGTERHFGVLSSSSGGSSLARRFVALPRGKGGLYLLANSGPKVTLAAQLFDLVVVGADGSLIGRGIDAPSSVQDVALAESTGGAVLVATLGEQGVAARWLDEGVGWKTSFAFNPFRTRGDGPAVRDKTALVLPDAALPFDPGIDLGALVGARCPFSVATGPRSLLFACEEGTGATPLAARAVIRTATF